MVVVGQPPHYLIASDDAGSILGMNTTSSTQPTELSIITGVQKPGNADISKAEAALIERAKATAKTYTIKGKTYTLQNVVPAVVFKYFSSLQNSDYEKAIDLFVALFDRADAEAVRGLVMDQDTDTPLDITYLNDAIQEIMELVSDRPLDSA